MDKILKPYTIIPPELYIARDADRQVDNIVRDMGRPGYVLVSRQMGKTNLLLNAKRRLENANDIFAYIDLSNPFDELRGCFENIIDTILDTNEERLSDVAETIQNNRKQQKDIPPFKQHENELRLILKHISGKLVIILDEIDALTKRQYSDQIFAQIRSIYFSRANHKELERLTYILSGVVEPSEIIKDPKISPFNIGEKIFLNDFSKSEFEQFLANSKLTLPETIKDRIYFWTDGNPRIIWDVCSEIEDRFTNRQELSQKDIDNLIAEMYLTTFDRPPVDNIRELVVNDRELRDAIIEISYKKGKEVSDKIKSKLYLAGITNYNKDNDVHIKNEIIKQSLNLDWIKKVEEEDKGLIKLAKELYDKENYSEALLYFEKFIKNNEFDSEMEGSMYYYYMGRSAYRISNFEKSLEYLNLTKFKKNSLEEPFYYWTLNLKGVVSFYVGNTKDSLSYLQQIIDDNKGDESYVQALLNYGIFSNNSNIKERKQESKTIFENIINEVGYKKDKFSLDFINEIKSISYYNIAQAYNKEKNIDKAIENYESSLNIAKIEMQPVLLLGLLNTIQNDTQKKRTLSNLINVIIENDLHPIHFDPDKQLIFNDGHLQETLIISFLNSYSDFEKLKPWLHFLGEKAFANYIYDLAYFSIVHKNDWNSAIVLLNKIYDNFDSSDYNTDEVVKYNTLQLLAFAEFQDIKKTKEYVSIFSKNRVKPIDYLDFSVFANLISVLINRKDFNRALQYTNIIQSVKQEVDKHLLINYIVICNFELLAYHYLNKYDKAKVKAVEILELCNDETIKKQKSNLLGDTGLETIRKNAESILQPKIQKTMPITVGKKYGPNEWVTIQYKDGRTNKIKYKKVQSDIEKGECFIVNE